MSVQAASPAIGRTTAKSLTFTYGIVGNRTEQQDSLSGVTTSVYDAANQLTTRKFSDGTHPWRIDLVYTPTHQTSSQTRFSRKGSWTECRHPVNKPAPRKKWAVLKKP